MNNSTDGSDSQERRLTPGRLLPGPSGSSRQVSTFAPLERPFAMAEGPPALTLQHLRDVVRKHRWKIVAFVVLAQVVTAIVTRRLTPLYEATAQINVERRGNGGFIGQQASQPQAGGSELDQMMLTQAAIAESDPVLRPATVKYDLLAREKQFSHLTPAEAGRLRNAPIKLKRLKVSRVPNTYIIKISYKADDPQLAADVANTIAESYVAHAFDSRNRSYVQVTQVVDRQLNDLRNKMSVSGQALAKYAIELNLIDPEQRINILTSRLMQLNTDYTNAQSERLKKEAIFNQTKSGSVASAEVSSQGETLQQLGERLNAARQQFSIIRTTFGEKNPEYKKSQNEVNELERQFNELHANALERVQVDFSQALAREQMARTIVADTKQEVDSLNQRVFEYQRLKSGAENDKKLLDDLERVTNEQNINRTFQDAVVQIEDPARAPSKQAFPSMPLNLSLGFMLWGLLGIGAALVHDQLDTKLRGPEQAAKLLNVDVIATLPKTKNLSLFSGGDPAKTQVVGQLPKTERTKSLMQYQESIRALRNVIGLTDFSEAHKSLVLTSANAGEGKSTIAANLAFSYSLLGKKVLLIDADLRHPSLHKFYEKPGDMGLAEVLEDKCKWNDILLKVAREQLFLLPAGQMSDSSPDLIASGIKRLMEEARASFDLVIIDAPPLGVAESLQLAALSDAVLVIARAGSTSTKQVGSAYKSLARVRANVIGLVMSNVSDSDSNSLYPGSEPRVAQIT